VSAAETVEPIEMPLVGVWRQTFVSPINHDIALDGLYPPPCLRALWTQLVARSSVVIPRRCGLSLPLLKQLVTYHAQPSYLIMLHIMYRPRNDLYCVEWGVKLYSIHPTHALGV